MRYLNLLLTAPIALSVGCATISQTQHTVSEAVDMVRSVQASVNTVLARPAPLANTQVDEAIIRGAYNTFDRGLTIIEWLADHNTPGFQRNSPSALRIRAGVLTVKRTLRVAYNAQRIGNAATVRQALGEARVALTGLQSTMQGR